MGMVDERPGRVTSAFGLAYNRLMADFVPGICLALLLLGLFPRLRAPLAGDGALGAAVVLGATLLVLASGLFINFLGFTAFWPGIRRVERALDMGRRARAIFGIDRIRREVKLEGDAWWRFVDACEDLVLTRHPAWFEPYAHVDGMRKMVRGLAVVALLAIPLLLAAHLPAESWPAVGALAGVVVLLVLGAGVLLVYSGWMSGYYHAALVQSVHLNSLMGGGEPLRRLAHACADDAEGATAAPPPAQP